MLDPNETAIRQVERLGFRPDDIHYIMLTHFDIDHIPGLSDFPQAQVHLTSTEAQGAIHYPYFTESQRYNSRQWAYGPKIVRHPRAMSSGAVSPESRS
ncbi:MBL fold metallo-hydrolase [Paenirhodobacter populi]|uniref:MBL fold metallo-hydrolase n=1 Tax=Paenirhodobacter populi TaxID=2306993 RepID=UPI0019D48B98|nr:MBL fold metallo-hydrolase [Sinirhodobacter populi]